MLEYFVFQILQLLFVLADRENETDSFLLELDPLEPDHLHQQLVFQAAGRDREVYQSHLDGHLGQIVRVRHLGRDEHLEVEIVRDVRVAQSQKIARPLLYHLFQQNRLEGGVQLLLHVLDQAGLPESNAILQYLQEIALAQFSYLQVILLLQFAEPFIRLILRVDYQRPSPAIEYQYTILT